MNIPERLWPAADRIQHEPVHFSLLFSERRVVLAVGDLLVLNLALLASLTLRAGHGAARAVAVRRWLPGAW